MDREAWPGQHGPRNPVTPPPLRIVAAAIIQDGVVYTGPHHVQIIRYMVPLLGLKTVKGEQGFMTSRNYFVGRQEARKIAVMAGQVGPKTHHPRDLFSEDLWSVPDPGWANAGPLCARCSVPMGFHKTHSFVSPDHPYREAGGHCLGECGDCGGPEEEHTPRKS